MSGKVSKLFLILVFSLLCSCESITQQEFEVDPKIVAEFEESLQATKEEFAGEREEEFKKAIESVLQGVKVEDVILTEDGRVVVKTEKVLKAVTKGFDIKNIGESVLQAGMLIASLALGKKRLSV